MARAVAIGWIVCALAGAASGCSCAEAWSVAEELGPEAWAESSSLDVTQNEQVSVVDPGLAGGEPDPGRSPEPTTGELAERFGSFVGGLCMRMRRGNETYVELHVDLPIEVRLRDEGPSGVPVYRDEVFDDPWDLRMSGICADLTWLGAGMQINRREDHWLALASGNGSSVELKIRETPKGRLKLVRFRQL
ncbi:MAG: hypothetical protein JRF63_13310 [Deltaproteobacteria bacterium]|nr:hypothetical protein [Deltaproteobacteria bacterium]